MPNQVTYEECSFVTGDSSDSYIFFFHPASLVLPLSLHSYSTPFGQLHYALTACYVRSAHPLA